MIATWKYARIGIIVLVMLVVAVLLPMMGLTREHEREVRLVAIDKTFYVEGQAAPNPTLRVRAGERIRLVFRNEDDGMRHDVKIREWNVSVPPISGKGERAVIFRVPDAHRGASYACTPHSSSMRGSIEVE